MPNFLIIGTAKAGTTAIDNYLQQHPQIYTTPVKEPSFFTFEGKEINFQGIGDEAIKEFVIRDIGNYQKQFLGVTDELAIGETSPVYLYDSDTPKNIYKYIPDVRLIVILRNPIERTYANFLHLIRDNRETEINFESALKREKERIQNNWEWFWHYKNISLYSRQLERYYNLFDRDRIAVYLYDDFQSNPLKLLQNIFSFLNVDPNFIPDLSIRPNKTGVPKNKLLHQLISRKNPLKTLFKPLFPKSLRQKIRHNNLVKPEISSSVKRQLYLFFLEDIFKCQDLIDRDLSMWLKDIN